MIYYNNDNIKQKVTNLAMLSASVAFIYNISLYQSDPSFVMHLFDTC